MINIPGGTVTFMFTDIEGSTMLAQNYSDKYNAAMKKHHDLLNKLISSENGFVFENIGDAFCSAFANADDAVYCAVEIQKRLKTEDWDETPIKVRIGIHSGNAEWNGTTYMGYITLARTNRIMSAAHGEQILISNDAVELAKDKVSSDYVFRDLGERRMKDLIHPMRLFQIVTEGIREDFPVLKTLDARPNNLPVQLTSFIGREDEMKQVKNILKQNHLTTLTGSGGSGKTRLAFQVAADMIDEFENGVWYTELASLSDSMLLPQTIANVLGLKEEPKRTMEETLSDYLRDKEMLLILDNCEHMIDACARVAELLLSKSPKLKIIATSREALRCSGEMTHRIMSLEVPDSSKKISPEKLAENTSVKLFIERAIAVNPKFRLNEENASSIAQICFQLDGIPLAIELAAARINVLSVDKINERLSDRFKLLTGGRRTALPRQQTLKALIDWSYDLLSDIEKTLWNRLSVFSGGWTLEAAEIICSDDKIDESDILGLLDNLTEKSVTIYYEEKERYGMLETMRSYGEDKLKNSGELKFVSDRHFKFFREIAEQSEPALYSSEMKFYLKKLNDENGNLENALHWSIIENEPGNGLKLAGALGNFWQIRGNYSEGRHWFESFIGKSGVLKSPDYCKALKFAGTFTKIQGDYELALKLLNECLVISREINDMKSIADAISGLGNLKIYTGDFEDAADNLEEGLKFYKELNDNHGIAATINDLGLAALNRGENETAQKYFQESLEIRTKSGDSLGIANSYNLLATAAYYKGNNDLALELYEKSLQMFRETGEKRSIGNLLNNLGSIANFQEQFEKSLTYHEESLSIRREIGDKNGIASSLHNLGVVSYHMKNYTGAENYFRESTVLFRELQNKEGIAQSLNYSGLIASDQNDFVLAEKMFEESLSVRKSLADKSGLSMAFYYAGSAALKLGNTVKAESYFKEGLSLIRTSDELKEILTIIIGIMEIFLLKSNYINVALLSGFTGSAINSKGISLDKNVMTEFEELNSKVKEYLGKTEYDRCCSEGSNLTSEKAVDIALTV
ncbi:MAG: tetratricopeptide repeat protein [Ignavibacteria bacterium]|nr:tetratricopeptide repeat protein [Ignavibacteria bacterium]